MESPTDSEDVNLDEKTEFIIDFKHELVDPDISIKAKYVFKDVVKEENNGESLDSSGCVKSEETDFLRSEDKKDSCEVISPTQREPLQKTEKREAIDKVEPMYVNLADWKMKYEEVEIKEEFLEPHETSNSSTKNKSKTDTVYQCDNQPRNNCNLPRQVKSINNDHCDYKTVHKGLNKCFLKHRNPEEADMFKCYHCVYQAKRKHHLKMHILRHANPEKIKMFKCDQCDYQTIWKNSLKRHFVRHANPEEIKMFKCDRCDYQTIWELGLKRHLLRHANPEEIKLYNCDQCEYQTIRKNNLKKHLSRHTKGVTRLKCDQCEYQTFEKYSLRKHRICHRNPDEIKKFKCDQCEYQTNAKCSLKKHVVCHKNSEEIKKFECDQCGYQTNRRDSLKNHLLKQANPADVTKLTIRLNFKRIIPDFQVKI